VIDCYKDADSQRGLKSNTIKGNASAGSCFLQFMQGKGLYSMSDIGEKTAMSFFTDESGNASLSSGYKKQIAAVFKADLGKYTEDARRILAYLPCIRPRRKTIPYLQPEENQELHKVFIGNCKAGLSLRDQAIATLLFFTGLRPCDIASLTLDEVDWDADEIRMIQNKTDVPLVLPLTAMVGNAIYDYITAERPESSDRHIFLGKNRPHDPIAPSALWYVASKIYAAGIRLTDGDRRGTHLFRYNAATTFIGNGIPRSVASAILGHEDPSSLDHYTFADIKHLRECALSIEKFPVREGVFDI
jgi:integrase